MRRNYKLLALVTHAILLNAEIGVSRVLIDIIKFYILYDKKVGLTGKTVSTKIYIAIGSLGTIRHICTIEGSGTIIAINPDKDV